MHFIFPVLLYQPFEERRHGTPSPQLGLFVATAASKYIANSFLRAQRSAWTLDEGKGRLNPLLATKNKLRPRRCLPPVHPHAIRAVVYVRRSYQLMSASNKWQGNMANATHNPLAEWASTGVFSCLCQQRIKTCLYAPKYAYVGTEFSARKRNDDVYFAQPFRTSNLEQLRLSLADVALFPRASCTHVLGLYTKAHALYAYIRYVH